MLRIISIILLLSFFFTSTLAPVAAAISYSYDANGNMTSDGTRCFEYDDANQLKKVKSCANNQTIAEYLYDHSGKRLVKKEYENGTLKHTIYSPTDEYETKKLPNGTTENTTYFKVNDEVVAKKNPDGSLTYFHNDHLGSTSVLTNQSGEVVEKSSYEPYGEVKAGGTKSKWGYTGQEKDIETGLNYYDARYYDPHIHRFTQPDSLIQDAYDPQSLNRYSYVRNNPLRYTDPTGHSWGSVFKALARPVLNFLVKAAPSIPIVNNLLNKAQNNQTVQQVAQKAQPIVRAAQAAQSNPYVKHFLNNVDQTDVSRRELQQVVNNSGKISSLVQKIHGNDLRNNAQAVGYYLRDIESHAVKKIGIHADGLVRYTKDYYEKHSVYMDPQVWGPKIDIRVWEHEQIGEFLIKQQTRPELNYWVDRAVNIFR